jgi:plasmid replication initiation protein
MENKDLAEYKDTKSGESLPDHWLAKRNPNKYINVKRMTHPQLRLFSMYLSRIDPKDIKSRKVTFKLDEYVRIMQFNLDDAIRPDDSEKLKDTADDLLGLTVTFFDKGRGYDAERGLIAFMMCQMFKCFRLFKNSEGEWLVRIDCHDETLRLLFELKDYYFKYRLWNHLKIADTYQLQMYELLKQHEHAGTMEIKVKDLRGYLGLKSDEHSNWENFRKKVLDVSQEALASYTDIKFAWKIAEGQRSRGGKDTVLKFKIEKNNGYKRQQTLDEFMMEQGVALLDEKQSQNLKIPTQNKSPKE